MNLRSAVFPSEKTAPASSPALYAFRELLQPVGAGASFLHGNDKLIRDMT
jgi:hypothetical protein